MTEQLENPHRIEIIEELSTLLSQEAEEDSPVIQWFQDCKNKKEKNLTSYDPDLPLSEAGANQPTCVLPKLLHLLRDCLLSQEWDKALEALTGVAKSPMGSSYPVWKCGLELMQCDQEENNDSLIRNLYNQMKYVTDLNCHEVILDYLMFLLKKGQMENAKEAVQENITHWGLKKETTERDLYMSVLLKGYSGLVWYVEWKHCQQTVNSLMNLAEQDTDSLTMSSQTSTVFLEMQMNNYAQKAMACFQALGGQAGVWDIFIQKYVELLVYSEKLDEALQVLTEYQDTNPDNPCAMRYLYNFYQEHYPDSEQTLALQKELAVKLPADQIVVEYCERIINGNESSVLPHLFKLLDYPCWQREVKPWKLLADCLVKLLKTSDKDQSSVKSCWQYRRAWWPQYHFNRSEIVEQSSKFGLNYYKAVVAGLLCGTDTDLVTSVQESLHEDELEELSGILQNCHTGVT